MDFDELTKANKERCEAHFHSIDDWKPSEWSNAMAGECGEACNITKKMSRIWPSNQFKQNWNNTAILMEMREYVKLGENE